MLYRLTGIGVTTLLHTELLHINKHKLFWSPVFPVHGPRVVYPNTDS